MRDNMRNFIRTEDVRSAMRLYSFFLKKNICTYTIYINKSSSFLLHVSATTCHYQELYTPRRIKKTLDVCMLRRN